MIRLNKIREYIGRLCIGKELDELIFKNKDLSIELESLKTSLKPNYYETYYNDKYPKADLTYLRHEIDGDYYIDLRDFFMLEDSSIPIVTGENDNEKALNSLIWILDHIHYKLDSSADTYKINEYWAYPYQTLHHLEGDCLPIYEEIFTKEGIKKIGDLKIGDIVLSYDFKNKEFIYKPIINIWKKGKKRIKRIHFRNGTFSDFSEEHKLPIREKQKYQIYPETKVKNIDLSRDWKSRITISKNIPYEIKNIEWLNKDLCFIIGHFIAEGYIDKSHIRTSGYDCYLIAEKLENNNIPFSEGKNGQGVPYINFLQSEFKEYLKLFKKNSFDIHLPEEIFHLPKEKLQSFLDGYFLGDGHWSGEYNGCKTKLLNYSTSSEQLAKDLMRIHLQLGQPVYCWKQLIHGGLGKKPIFRLRYNPNSAFLKDWGFKDISEVGISYIEDLNETEMIDFEVQDTHTFVLRNGIISYNCEDMSILLANIMIKSGIPYWKVRITCGDVDDGKGNKGGHCFVTFFDEINKIWVLLDCCYYPNRLSISERNEYKDETYYKTTWFSWNEKYCFAKDIKDIESLKIEIKNNRKI